MKRGIETQFTWIFILIAGAVILTFFITIGYRQQSASEQTLAIRLEQSIDSIISAALQSPGTSLTIPTPRAGIAFSCTRTCDCNLFVGNKGTQFGEKIYFAPPRIEDTDMILWTQHWNVPFRTTNFLYIIDPRTTYYFVTTSTTHSLRLRDSLIDILPPQINAHFIDISDLASIENTGPARFIFLRSGKNTLHESFADDILHAVEISDNTAQFLLKDEGVLSFEHIGDPLPLLADNIPLILGAAYSFDRDMYACGIRHAYLKQHLIASIFALKAEQLDGHDNRCFYIGPAAVTPLQDLAHASLELSALPENAQLTSQIDQIITTLDEKNREKITDGCPALY